MLDHPHAVLGRLSVKRPLIFSLLRASALEKERKYALLYAATTCGSSAHRRQRERGRAI